MSTLEEGPSSKGQGTYLGGARAQDGHQEPADEPVRKETHDGSLLSPLVKLKLTSVVEVLLLWNMTCSLSLSLYLSIIAISRAHRPSMTR